MTFTPRQLQRLKQLPPSFKQLYRRCYGQFKWRDLSPRERIKAFCCECMGFDRIATQQCSSQECPLWPERPFQENESLEDVQGPQNGEEKLENEHGE